MKALATRATVSGPTMFLAICLQFNLVAADMHQVQIEEVMAGRDGDPGIQFVEMTMLVEVPHQKCQGTGFIIDLTFERCVESGPGARLVFFDAAGNQTAEFIFPSNTPIGGFGRSILIATPQFVNLGTTPLPDFIMPANVVPNSGKVCYKDRPGSPFPVNLCLSYGSFTGNTEGFGTPAPALPITGNSSLKRVNSNFDNSAFALRTPEPRDNCGAVSSSDGICLKVTKAGVVSETVTSSPAGIACVAFCPETSAAFSSGTVVTLTATSASGAPFTGWIGGGCSGTGTCTVTMTVATSVTAVFGSVPLLASVLPSSRSVRVAAPATAFVTILNAGLVPAPGVGIALSTAVPAKLDFQTTNPATNEVVGTPNTKVDIPVGGAQSFVIALTPTAAFAPIDVGFVFAGTNAGPVVKLTGLNTLLLSASPPTAPAPDIVALAATGPPNDGIVNIPGLTGTGVFGVATVNLDAGGTITASADTGGVGIPVSLRICETNPATAVCVNPPLPSAIGSTTTFIAANATPTFAIFVQGTGNVTFDAARNRIFVHFRDAGGAIRGSTSVAVRTN